MPQDYATPYFALTLPMLTLIALDDLRTAATHRRIDTGTPVFLAPVRTEAFWSARQSIIRRSTISFRLGTMLALFDAPIDYPLLHRFETHLSAAVWRLVHDLQIVDGSSFVELPETEAPPVYTAHDNEVAVVMQIDRERGFFRLTAAVVN